MNNDSLAQDNTSQFALSYELLHLLRWLAQHDTDKLKKLIAKAIGHGLHDEIRKTNSASDQNILEEMHHGIIDFFEILDTMLSDAINDHVELQAKQKNLLPTIEHLDSSLLDNDTLRDSVEKTTKKLETHPHMNPKEQLCKELLKKWKPLNKQSIH